MIFDFQMTCFVDDDVLDIFSWEVNEIEVQRNLLVIGTWSSFGNCFSNTEFCISDSYFFAIVFKYRCSIVFQNLFQDFWGNRRKLERSRLRFLWILLVKIFEWNLFAEKQDGIFLYCSDMCSCIVAFEKFFSFLDHYGFKFTSFFGKRNGDKELSFLIYSSVSVSDMFIFYLHVFLTTLTKAPRKRLATKID